MPWVWICDPALATTNAIELGAAGREQMDSPPKPIDLALGGGVVSLGVRT